MRSEHDEQAIARQVNSIELAAREMRITCHDELTRASEFLVAIKKHKDRLEETRRWLVGPLNKQVRDINARFRQYAEPLARADRIVREKVLAYRREQEESQRKEREALQALADEAREELAEQAAEMGLPEVPAPVVPGPEVRRTVRVDGGAVTTRKYWTFEIVEAEAIPREYLKPDTDKIAAAVKAGVREIPGVRIFQAESLQVRR